MRSHLLQSDICVRCNNSHFQKEAALPVIEQSTYCLNVLVHNLSF
ncbi:hypothetical protein EV146_110106 [Mesobacillus foraminis]|uniref:Uncharacterized protein n=1 Tax=Mesobacillus foraminis TaxID=279826 RepID=A0A4R2B7E0_9BACI|nr:hypothetical protein EV146_110106 [Mesobacillus foraminis]